MEDNKLGKPANYPTQKVTKEDVIRRSAAQAETPPPAKGEEAPAQEEAPAETPEVEAPEVETPTQEEQEEAPAASSDEVPADSGIVENMEDKETPATEETPAQAESSKPPTDFGDPAVLRSIALSLNKFGKEDGPKMGEGAVALRSAIASVLGHKAGVIDQAGATALRAGGTIEVSDFVDAGGDPTLLNMNGAMILEPNVHDYAGELPFDKFTPPLIKGAKITRPRLGDATVEERSQAQGHNPTLDAEESLDITIKRFEVSYRITEEGARSVPDVIQGASRKLVNKLRSTTNGLVVATAKDGADASQVIPSTVAGKISGADILELDAALTEEYQYDSLFGSSRVARNTIMEDNKETTGGLLIGSYERGVSTLVGAPTILLDGMGQVVTGNRPLVKLHAPAISVGIKDTGFRMHQVSAYMWVLVIELYVGVGVNDAKGIAAIEVS